MDTYDLPYFRASSFKIKHFLLYGFCILLFYAGAIAFIAFDITENLLINILFALFTGILATFFAAIMIYIGILHKMSIEITNDYICISSMFKKHTAKWNEIAEVQYYKVNGNIDMLGFTLKNDSAKFKRRSFYNNLNSYLSYNRNSFRISLAYFEDADLGKLLNTIQMQLNKSTDDENKDENSTNDFEENFGNSIIKAMFSSLILSILFGIIYGFSIYKLEKNYVVIPWFFSIVIISAFNKFCDESNFNVVIRIVLGLICSLQVLIGLSTNVFLWYELTFSLDNVVWSITEYFKFLIDPSLTEIWPIITFIICFGIGAFTGKIKSEKEK